jgi:hypothetical protein
MAQRIAKEGGAKGGGVTAAIVLGAVLLLAALPLCLIVVGGMLPTAVAFLVDRSPRRDLARTVAAANAAGVVPPAMAFFQFGFSFAASFAVLAEPRNWLVMYGAAAIGWGLHAAMPPLARSLIEFRARQTEARLAARAAEIAVEWGEVQPPK